MKISETQIQQAYLVASAVFDGKIAASDGARQLESLHELNINSAKIFIRNFRHLLLGERFRRTGSVPAMDYFLSQIALDGGQEALGNAVAALRKHIEYYDGLGKSKLKMMRQVLAKHEANLTQTQSWAQHEDEFRQAVEKAMNDDAVKRQQRLKEAAKLPKKMLMQVEVFQRNSDVVAEVLLRANGECERCKAAAPFKRKSNGSPYLEVHHKRKLANGGEDTVENAEALCPNCHREMHFG